MVALLEPRGRIGQWERAATRHPGDFAVETVAAEVEAEQRAGFGLPSRLQYGGPRAVAEGGRGWPDPRG
ncbi:hypothetical protein [Streptomyces misionensis]|uniref:hypothetical protein n=1 Tax=Streptomyces misionensis TaxID=67331 RepID=UPI0021BD37AA|nr:hypothetical protein [Streptomyces misionensis]